MPENKPFPTVQDVVAKRLQVLESAITQAMYRVDTDGVGYRGEAAWPILSELFDTVHALGVSE